MMLMARKTAEYGEELPSGKPRPLRRDSYPVKKRLNNINKVIKKLQIKQKLDLGTFQTKTVQGSERPLFESKKVSNPTSIDYNDIDVAIEHNLESVEEARYKKSICAMCFKAPNERTTGELKLIGKFFS